MSKVFAIVLLVLFLASCTSHLDNIADIREFVVVDGVVRDRVLSGIRNENLNILSFRSISKLNIQHSVSASELSQIFVCEKPDNIRLELFVTNLNHLLYLMTNRSEELKALDVENNTFLFGKSSPENIERLLFLPLSIEEFAFWMSGHFPLPAQSIDAKPLLFIHRIKPLYLLRWDDSDGRNVHLLYEGSVDHVRLSKIQISDKNNEPVLFSDIIWGPERSSNEAQIGFPQLIQFTLTKLNFSAKYIIESYELNPDITSIRDRLFQFFVPPSAQQVNLDEVKDVKDLSIFGSWK